MSIKNFFKMEYLTNCTAISGEEWDNLMKGQKRCSGKRLRAEIKKHLPELYNALCLDFSNPYEDNSSRNPKTRIAVYVHSAIEYFIKY